jgi:hypothetical protein
VITTVGTKKTKVVLSHIKHQLADQRPPIEILQLTNIAGQSHAMNPFMTAGEMAILFYLLFVLTLTRLTPSKVLLPAFSGGVLLSATMLVFLGRRWNCS